MKGGFLLEYKKIWVLGGPLGIGGYTYIQIWAAWR